MAEKGDTSPRDQQFRTLIGAREQRKLRARRNSRPGVLPWFGMFGIVGWSVAVPTVIAVAAGVWLDRCYPCTFSWTLTLLFLGIVAGCALAWYWVRRESRRGRAEDTA